VVGEGLVVLERRESIFELIKSPTLFQKIKKVQPKTYILFGIDNIVPNAVGYFIF